MENNYLTKIEPNSVELWAEEFSNFEPQTLSVEDIELLGTIAFNEIEFDKIDASEIEKDSDGFKFISSMSKAYPFKLTNSSICFISFGVKSPGDIRMLLAYIFYKLSLMKFDFEDVVDLNTIVRIFPLGFPSDEWLSEMWSKQKYDGVPDNMLDHKLAYESLL